MPGDVVLRWGPRTVGVLTRGSRALRGRELHPAERALRDALPLARRPDFTVGRQAARAALAAVGRAGPVLRSGPLPLFPAGVRGSLSHCAGRVGAALVSRDPAVAAVGIDVERVGRLSELGIRRALNEGELARLPPGGAERARQATIVFGAKESLYKAATTLLPGGRWRPEPADMDIGVAGDGTLRVSLGGAGLGPGLAFTGRVRRVGPYVVTYVLVTWHPGVQPGNFST